MLGKNVAGKDPDPFFYILGPHSEMLYRSEIFTTTKEARWEPVELTTRYLLNGAYIAVMDKDQYGASDRIGQTFALKLDSFVFGETRLPLQCASESLSKTRGDCGTIHIQPVKPSRQWPTFQMRHQADNLPVFGGYLQAAQAGQAVAGVGGFDAE